MTEKMTAEERAMRFNFHANRNGSHKRVRVIDCRPCKRMVAAIREAERAARKQALEEALDCCMAEYRDDGSAQRAAERIRMLMEKE